MQLLELVSPPERQDVLKLTLSPSQRTAADGVLLGLSRGDCATGRHHRRKYRRGNRSQPGDADVFGFRAG